LLLQGAVVIVVLVLSLVEASAWSTMAAAAGCSGDRRAGALLGGGIDRLVGRRWMLLRGESVISYQVNALRLLRQSR
jgi:hypothetical protein